MPYPHDVGERRGRVGEILHPRRPDVGVCGHPKGMTTHPRTQRSQSPTSRAAHVQPANTGHGVLHSGPTGYRTVRKSHVCNLNVVFQTGGRSVLAGCRTGYHDYRIQNIFAEKEVFGESEICARLPSGL